MANLNVEVLKLPLGFIRIVELPMILIAFGSMSGWEKSFKYTPNCLDKPAEKTYHVDTFKLDKFMIASNSCFIGGESSPAVPLWGEGYGSSSGFFIFTGIVSLLFVLAILAVYLLLWGSYESDSRLASLDFVITAVLTVFWFLGTIFWWSGANGIGHLTSKASIQTQLTFRDAACGPPKSNLCPVTLDGGNSGLVISVLAGWACSLLFLANCWFVYKETIWFRNREASRAYADSQNTAYTAPPQYAPPMSYQR